MLQLITQPSHPFVMSLITPLEAEEQQQLETLKQQIQANGWSAGISQLNSVTVAWINTTPSLLGIGIVLCLLPHETPVTALQQAYHIAADPAIPKPCTIDGRSQSTK